MNEPIIELRKRLSAHSYRAVAKDLGFSPGYLNQVEKGLRPASDGLVRALGYEKIVVYRKLKK